MPRASPGGVRQADVPQADRGGAVRRSPAGARGAVPGSGIGCGQARPASDSRCLDGPPEQRLSGRCRVCPGGDVCQAARPHHASRLGRIRAGLSDRVHDETADHRIAPVVGEGGSGRTVGRTSAVGAFRVATATVRGSARPPPPSPRRRHAAAAAVPVPASTPAPVEQPGYRVGAELAESARTGIGRCGPRATLGPFECRHFLTGRDGEVLDPVVVAASCQFRGGHHRCQKDGETRP